MSIGWFDAFRENGAPTWVDGESRPPFSIDLQIAALLSAFITPILAFLIILPGIRRLRAVSTLTFLFSMAVGATIMVSIYYPSWQTGKVRINSNYKAFTAERMHAVLGVKIGLRHVNITFISKPDLKNHQRNLEKLSQFKPPLQLDKNVILKKNNSQILANIVVVEANPLETTSTLPELDYNERMDFDVNSMEIALEKGLPYPILKVIEYLSADRTEFLWGRQYRLAGYYTNFTLWFGFACWLLQMLLLGALPHYFAHSTFVVGLITVSADLIYVYCTPKHLIIRFPGIDGVVSLLQFKYSICFFATLIAGLCSILFGGLLWLIQIHTGYVFETFLSAYLDALCQKEDYTTTKNSTSYNDSTSSTCATDNSSTYLSSIQLIRQQRKAIEKATFERMQNGCATINSKLNCISNNGAEVTANYISPQGKDILCIEEETEGPKNFKASQFCIEQGELLTSSSCGGSSKSLETIDEYGQFKEKCTNPDRGLRWNRSLIWNASNWSKTSTKQIENSSGDTYVTFTMITTPPQTSAENSPSSLIRENKSVRIISTFDNSISNKI